MECLTDDMLRGRAVARKNDVRRRCLAKAHGGLADLPKSSSSRKTGPTAESVRRDIKAALHDGVAQTLQAILMQASGVASSGRSDQLDQALDKIRWLASTGLQEVRSLALGADLGVGLAVSLPQMLSRLADTMTVPGVLHCRFDDESDEPVGSDAVARVLQTTARELLQNTARHAGAKQARITLGTGSGWCFVQVQDDGVGIDLAKLPRLLARMRERVEPFEGAVVTVPTCFAGSTGFGLRVSVHGG